MQSSENIVYPVHPVDQEMVEALGNAQFFSDVCGD